MKSLAIASPPRAGPWTRLRSGVAWNLIAAVCTQGSTLAINIVVANILGRQTFGEYAMIQSTLLTLATISQLAMGYTATRYVAEFRSTDRDKTGRILGLCSMVSASAACVGALALLAAAPWLSAHVLQAPHLAPGLMIVAAVVPFAVMNGYQIGALAGLEGYRVLATSCAISGALSVVVSTFAARGGEVNGVLTGLALSAFLQWLTLGHFLRAEIARRQIVIRYRGLHQEFHILVRFALPATLSGLVSLPTLWLANTFLVRQFGGYEQLALYSAANSFRMLVLFLPTVINGVAVSVLNNQRSNGDDSQFRHLFWANLHLAGALVLLGALVVAVSGPWLLTVFGAGFANGYPVLIVLMVATVFEAFGAAVYQVIQVGTRMWLSLLAIVLPRNGAIVLLSYFLCERYGAVGLAFAYTSAWTLALLLHVSLARRVWFAMIRDDTPGRMSALALRISD